MPIKLQEVKLNDVKSSLLLLQNLEDRERKHTVHKEQLHREHRYLRRRLEQLNAHNALSKRRSVSECSTSTVSSTNSSSSGSPSSISESGNFYALLHALCGYRGGFLESMALISRLLKKGL